MNRGRSVAHPAGVTGLALMLSASMAAGHHSPALFDAQSEITISGVVTGVEWSNPHVYVSVREAGQAGAEATWLIEAFAPTALRQFGWSSDTLMPGDQVVVVGNPARDPVRRMAALQSIRRSGTVLLDLADLSASPRSATRGAAPEASSLAGVWATLPGPALGMLLDAPATLPATEPGIAAIRSFSDAANPGVDCVPFSAPLYMVLPGFKQIWLGEDSVVIRGEDGAVERTVYMDSTRDDTAIPSVQGHSIGRWEGDTLVVDTARFLPHRLGIAAGLPSGSGKHVVERFRLDPDGTSLTYTFVLEDPQYLTRSVTGTATWAYRPDVAFSPQQCITDNARRFLAE